MVAIRRSQSRRTLARLAAQRHGSPAAGPEAPAGSAAYDVLDVIEADEEAGRPATVTSLAATLNIDQPPGDRAEFARLLSRFVESLHGVTDQPGSRAVTAPHGPT